MNQLNQVTHASDASNGRMGSDRRGVLAASAVAFAFGILGAQLTGGAVAAAGDSSIRPFTVQVPQAALDDLRRRVQSTRWPERETVDDFSQGVQLDKLKPLVQYWLTNTGTSSSRSYWDAAQGGGGTFNAFDIQKVPVAVTIFPGEIYRAPRSRGEQAFKNLIYWNEVDKGGHFAALEQPQLFAEEMRAASRPLRSKNAH